jgi:hypothetical protein
MSEMCAKFWQTSMKGRPRHEQKNNIEMYLKRIGYKGLDSSGLG